MLKAFIGRNASTWSDLKTLGQYAYVVTEGGGGMQIIDLSDLDNIQQIGTYNGFSTAHNLFIDEAAAIAYAPGANTGMPILDLSNPTNPVEVVRYTDDYVHDVMVQDGMAHLAEIYSGLYRILDVSALPSMPTLDSITTPGFFTHNTWCNAENTLCGTTDEVVGGHLALYDISDPTDIVKIGEYTENSGGIIHNVVIHGDVAHLSYYAEGYVAVDISDPSRPQKLGSYDTYSGSSGDYDGAWGVYPFQSSGVVYVNDIQSGLYVLAPAGSIEHDALADTLDPAGPYPVVATVTPSPGGSGLQSVELLYSTDDEQSFTTVAMTPTGNPDEYTADLPGQALGTVVHYYLRADDGLGEFRHPDGGGSHVFAVGTRITRYFNDFEATSDDGWTHGQNATQDDWQRGTPAGKAGDPSFAFSGVQCWSNDLGASGWNGFYSNDVDNWLLSPAIDLTGLKNTRLRVKRWLTVEDGDDDVAGVRVNGNEAWSNPTGVDHLDTSWVTLDLDISEWADDQLTQVEFTLTSDNTDTFGGWNLDDFEIYTIDDCRDVEHYGVGGVGSGGIVPTIDVSGGAPSIGNPNFTIEGHDMVGGAPVLLLVGLDRAQIPFKGFDILVDLGKFYFLFTMKADGSSGVPGDGDVFFSAPIPDDPTAVGVEIDCQFLVIDPGAPRGWAGTDGLAFWICEGDGD